MMSFRGQASSEKVTASAGQANSYRIPPNQKSQQSRVTNISIYNHWKWYVLENRLDYLHLFCQVKRERERMTNGKRGRELERERERGRERERNSDRERERVSEWERKTKRDKQNREICHFQTKNKFCKCKSIYSIGPGFGAMTFSTTTFIKTTVRITMKKTTLALTFLDAGCSYADSILCWVSHYCALFHWMSVFCMSLC